MTDDEVLAAAEKWAMQFEPDDRDASDQFILVLVTIARRLQAENAELRVRLERVEALWFEGGWSDSLRAATMTFVRSEFYGALGVADPAAIADAGNGTP